MIEIALARLRALARLLAWAGGAMLIAAALVVTLEVVLRKGVSVVLGPEYNFTGSDEIASYLFAVGTSWSLAYVVLTRGNVRIDAIYRLFGPRTRAGLDLVALGVLLVFASVLVERAYSVAQLSYVDHIRSNTTLRVPLAIPQIAWLAGLVVFLLAILVALTASLAALARGDLAAASEASGIATAQEEVSSELEGLGLKQATLTTDQSREARR